MSLRLKANRFNPMKAVRYIKDHKKELFWVWITYQCIKGMTTLTLIWIPLWLVWRGQTGG